MNIELIVKRIPHEGAECPLPARATSGSAGLDLCAAIPAPVTLEPGGSAALPTGIALALPGPECAAFVFARSGLAVKHGIALANGVGVVDSDYRGEILVGLVNLSSETYAVSPGERIAQLVVMPVAAVTLFESRELPPTRRAEGGFGSTGRFSGAAAERKGSDET